MSTKKIKFEENGKEYNDFNIYELRLKRKSERNKVNEVSDSEVSMENIELMCPR